MLNPLNSNGRIREETKVGAAASDTTSTVTARLSTVGSNSESVMLPVLHFYDIAPGVTAFSTTRQGGCSAGSYGEFNINRYCGDSAEAISRNRALLCQLLGIDDDRLLMPHQVHETEIVAVDGPSCESQLEGVDALMTNVAGLCIGVSTADCIPVLLCDQERRAVSAIHAGWRGTVKRIVEKTVAQMTAVYGSRPADIIAQIGPGIHVESFEVGDEVYEAFAAAGFAMEPISRRYGEKWHIDLPECNRRQLLSSGIPEAQISVLPFCTYQHPDLYFSARRLGINSGRIFTGIVLG